MDTASAYISMDWRQAIARGESLDEWQEGATLFADISGFTPLTEALTRELGPKRGSEELTVYLNRVYDALIAELHRLKGSVVSFSGDAITCWFDQDLDGLKATACALAMQETMQQFAQIQTRGGNIITLGMKAAVAIGRVRRFLVGDPSYLLIDAMAGETLENMVAAEHEAERGDVVLDALTAEKLAGRIVVAEWRTNPETGARFAVVSGMTVEVPDDPWPPLSDEALTGEQQQAWLLPPVYERLQSGRGEFLAELRPAAALFMRFDGIDYDNDPNASEKLDIFVRRVQQIIEYHEGSLLQLTIGDKGSYMYAAFGAPIAHEDDVQRAASSALAIQKLPDQFEFINPMQFGISHGRLRVGAYGSPQRRTYGVLGDPVNLSARLMGAAAPGEILVSSLAQAKTGRAFVWQELEPIKVKGKSDPVALSRLEAMRERRRGDTVDTQFMAPLIGRTDLLMALGRHLAELVEERQGSVIRLVGEAGMGKSHLATQFMQRALDRNVRVVQGSCQNITRNTPYYVWRQILFNLLALEGETELELIESLSAFMEAQNPDWMLRLPLLGDLLALPIPNNPTTAALDSDMRQKALYALLVEMGQTLITEPALFVFENAQWMDEASQMLLQTVAQQVAGTVPLTIFLVQRPEPVGNEQVIGEIGDLPYYKLLVLKEMPAAEIAALMRLRLGGQLTPLLATLVQKMTQGNPFFAGELISAMRKGGQIDQNEQTVWQVSDDLLKLLRRSDFVTQQDGQWQLNEAVDLSAVKLGIPDSIQGVILARLDRLPEPHKLTLKVSSVVGHYIDLALVSLAHPDEKQISEIETEIRYMETEEVLEEEAPERLIYVFRHHSLQEVTYDTLLFTQRQQLHQLIAEALVQQQPDAVMQIAHHAFLGEVWPLAMTYNLRAGQQAQQLHANQQSIDFYQKALQSAEALPEDETAASRKQIHLALGELFVSTGQYDNANENLRSALTLAKDEGDKETEARCSRWYGRSHELRGEYAVALTWLNRGFRALEGLESAEEAEIALIAGLINIRQGNYDQATQWCERSIYVSQVQKDDAIRARTYNLLGILERRLGRTALALDRFEQALRQYERLQNVYGQATSQNLIANGYFTRGEWGEAYGHYKRSLDQFVQIGDLYNQVLVSNNLGGIALKQGELDLALGYYERAVRLLEQTGGSLWVLGALHMNTGNTYIQRQELDQAADKLQLSEAYFQQAQLRDLLPELYGLFAEVELRQDRLRMAEEYGEQAVELARELKMPREEGHNLRIMAEVMQAKDDLEESERLFVESGRVLAETDDVYERAKAELGLAEFYATQQRTAEAEQLLGRCLPAFEQLGARLDLEKARELRGGLGTG